MQSRSLQASADLTRSREMLEAVPRSQSCGSLGDPFQFQDTRDSGHTFKLLVRYLLEGRYQRHRASLPAFTKFGDNLTAIVCLGWQIGHRDHEFCRSILFNECDLRPVCHEDRL